MRSIKQLIPEEIKKNLISNFYRIGNLPVIKRFVAHLPGNVEILMYHRVLPDAVLLADLSPNQFLGVSINNFEEHVRYLSRNHHVISIDDVPQYLASDNKKRAVVITFDDGYKDNLTYALPILQKYGVPATIYIVTRFPEGDCEMWWYEIWEILGGKDDLRLTWEGKEYNWVLGPLKNKINCFYQLRLLILSQSAQSQKELLKVLRAGKAGNDYVEDSLTWEEIIELDKNPLITIGAHTHAHPQLRWLEEEEARADILFSKRLLEKKLGHRVKHFAFPFGTKNEAGPREYRLAEECGFETAVTTLCHRTKTGQIFSIPRHPVSQRDSSLEIGVKISGWNALWKRPI
jgi:peptidoglycan/xylan/chitin deacetylase (PgdA/CDA1 family)